MNPASAPNQAQSQLNAEVAAVLSQVVLSISPENILEPKLREITPLISFATRNPSDNKDLGRSIDAPNTVKIIPKLTRIGPGREFTAEIRILYNGEPVDLRQLDISARNPETNKRSDLTGDHSGTFRGRIFYDTFYEPPDLERPGASAPKSKGPPLTIKVPQPRRLYIEATVKQRAIPAAPAQRPTVPQAAAPVQSGAATSVAPAAQSPADSLRGVSLFPTEKKPAVEKSPTATLVTGAPSFVAKRSSDGALAVSAEVGEYLREQVVKATTDGVLSWTTLYSNLTDALADPGLVLLDGSGDLVGAGFNRLLGAAIESYRSTLPSVSPEAADGLNDALTNLVQTIDGGQSGAQELVSAVLKQGRLLKLAALPS